ncbi:MAG: bifunctional isocitrate dehydrogenase kinase/phosphatase [Pseudomonadales bacterium]|nr:bifunctional isocitrate dehydrogenase kinase/phosphatase [Pseudomonadales bacterium]MDP6470715.1 bifunctional isocitrate dehydrogenase kinase/phosphatase [Pseudomonadales bacterium]MDP6828333.1 bifunctional isocitrate dehydrogenase kinase/phosphatase [Pseudomonadales bacterium]MDP6972117.1 bifunctional isocitrate dehydrogenase kinase/phosphatase [Pseudomonadales bacterium]
MDAAERVARDVFAHFRAYRNDFESLTESARRRFENADWLGIQDAGAQRLAQYNASMRRLVVSVRGYAPATFSPSFWRDIKMKYRALIATESDRELAETYYNSLHRHITSRGPVDDEQMFVAASFDDPPPAPEQPIFTTYHPHDGVVRMIKRICQDHAMNVPWRNLDRDVGNILRSLAEARPEIESARHLSVRVLNSLFYRNKGTYAVGALTYKDQTWPIVLPVLLDANGKAYVDTLICDEDELSVVFSFTRAYFMVSTPHPHGLIEFLHQLLPNKKRSELYASIGLHKHGKTEFYRGFVQHLADSDDPFDIAPGIKGTVMAVFMLPSYQSVFKVIKDQFPPQKNITAREVRAKYYTVKKHDRVGRMADTQEFENFAFPLARFMPELIAELESVAPSSISIIGNTIIIKHLYTERLMTPLNLFIADADEELLKNALDEYGNAIKQLAAANIFPGDMLLKNFGVTRHGRVVFYDYDEISYLSDVNFRAIPEPRTLEEEMSSEAWYSVAKNDVFPEEFRRFLFGKPSIKKLFTDMHGELFDPEYWKGLQEGIHEGHVTDVFPYRRKKRFARLATPSG